MHTHSDGILQVSSQSQQWRFYWLDKRLLYVWGSRFPVRRFQRVAHYYRPNWQWFIQPDWIEQSERWEISLLEQAIADRILSPIQLKLMLRMILQECSVELTHHKIDEHQYQPISIDISADYRAAALSEVEMRGVFRKSSHIYKNWQISRLRSVNLNDVPVVTEGHQPNEVPTLGKSLDGKTTLWDILLSQEPSMTRLASLLEPLMEDGVITFRGVSDLKLPIEGEPVEGHPVEGQPVEELAAQPAVTASNLSSTAPANSVVVTEPPSATPEQ
ncbi:MAG: hypothetical protein AAFU53_20085, partial [Cyanobacteria bacterium J06632_3]